MIIGRVTIGYISDFFRKRLPVAVTSLMIGALLQSGFFFFNEETHPYILFALLTLIGYICGGAFSLIYAVSTVEYMKSPAVGRNRKILGRVAGIVNGAGFFGSAFGQLLISWLIQEDTWTSFFVILIVSLFLSGLVLLRVLIKDLREHN